MWQRPAHLIITNSSNGAKKSQSQTCLLSFWTRNVRFLRHWGQRKWQEMTWNFIRQLWRICRDVGLQNTEQKTKMETSKHNKRMYSINLWTSVVPLTASPHGNRLSCSSSWPHKSLLNLCFYVGNQIQNQSSVLRVEEKSVWVPASFALIFFLFFFCIKKNLISSMAQGVFFETCVLCN